MDGSTDPAVVYEWTPQLQRYQLHREVRILINEEWPALMHVTDPVETITGGAAYLAWVRSI